VTVLSELGKLKLFMELERTKFGQVDKLFHLLEEMTIISDSFLVWLMRYCKKNKIPISQETNLQGYVKLSKRILKEIGEVSNDLQKLSDEFLQRKKSDKDFTEPLCFLSDHNRQRLSPFLGHLRVQASPITFVL
jgi:pyruvate-formate lyase-activating enzyme